jgi:regulator of replication initiation timing
VTKAGGSAQLIEATLDISKTQTIPIALNKALVTIASITIPSGALALTNGASTTSISIRAVSDSRVRYAVNEIVPSRRSEFGSYLDYPITVLSVAFECVLPQEVKPFFTLNFTYTAWIDLIPPVVDYKDVCLARLVELQGFSTWECLVSDRNLRGNSTTDASSFYVHKSGTPAQEVTSVFQSCSPSTAPGVVSPYNGSVFAFIFSPLPDVPASPEGLDVVQRNIVWIVLGILLGFALLILLAYCAFRLFRYREKYHTEREEADRLQEEVENMKQFGGDSGNKDDQVAMTANPLAVQLKDVQARYNEQEMKLQKAEAQLRKQEGEIRAQHIDNMRENRNKLATELEKLKAQLAEAQAVQPKATFEQDEGPTYTGDEPVREEFDTGSTAVAPKRGKKDL